MITESRHFKWRDTGAIPPKPEPMPRVTPQIELDQLLALIAAQPDGMGIDAIAKALGDSLPRRTLQRRLATLVAKGQVQIMGEARATRYAGVAQGVGAYPEFCVRGHNMHLEGASNDRFIQDCQGQAAQT